MNILYMHTHDMGRYNQVYGYAIPTPAFFAISQQSTVFRNAHSAAPTCSPSRAALLTGMSPHSAGMLGLAHRGFGLAQPRRHLSWFLREAGYHTALFGVQHEAADVRELGYEHAWEGTDEQSKRDQDAEAVARAAQFLEDRDDDRPFFLSVGMQCPHRPYLPGTPGSADFLAPPALLADVPQVRQDFADYIASVAWADHCCGQLVDAIRAKGLWDELLVILTTDHGIAFPHMKGSLTGAGTGVTLAVKLPRQRHHRVVDQLVSQIDVYPTLCDLLGLERPEWLEGNSLLPALTGEEAASGGPASQDATGDRAVFSEISFHAAFEPARCLRTERYSYIERYDGGGRPVLANIDAGGAKSWCLEHGLAGEQRPREELHDLLSDPMESRNLADDEALRPVKAQLRARLRAWQERTQDPVLAGFPDVPDAVRVNPVDQVDPDEVHLLDGQGWRRTGGKAVLR